MSDKSKLRKVQRHKRELSVLYRTEVPLIPEVCQFRSPVGTTAPRIKCNDARTERMIEEALRRRRGSV